MIHHINYRDKNHFFHHVWCGLSGMSRNWRLEVYSGRSLRLEFQRGEASGNGNSCNLSLGIIFFTASLSFSVPERFLLKRKCVATWDNNREFYLVEGRKYGFYFYQWAFVWHWHAKVHESSSSDPWWMDQYIHLDEILLGKWQCIRDNLEHTENVWFRIGQMEFKIDRIEWTRSRRFRSYIPFSLWHKTHYGVGITIDKPPMRAGKGENSWDLDDDGTFGLSAPWKGPVPRWDNLKEITPLAVAMYIDGCIKDAKRYGGSSGKRGISASDSYEFIGHRDAQTLGIA